MPGFDDLFDDPALRHGRVQRMTIQRPIPSSNTCTLRKVQMEKKEKFQADPHVAWAVGTSSLRNAAPGGASRMFHKAGLGTGF